MNDMPKETILDKLKRLGKEQFDLNPWEVTLEATIIDDLGIDSLGLVEGLLWLEGEFDLDINDEEADTWRTVGDVVKYLEEHAGK